MKKKNFFAQNKQFTFFLILAVLIILVAIFAPIVSGGVDPLKGDLNDALLAPSKAHTVERWTMFRQTAQGSHLTGSCE